MNFGVALEEMKKGGRVQRDSWNGRGMWLKMHVPPTTFYLPYFLIRTAEGAHAPWLPSHADLLADDWKLA